MDILTTVLVGVFGFVLGRVTKRTSEIASTPEERREIQSASKDALRERTTGRKEDILEMMRNTKERHEDLKACGLEVERKGINRQDVENLLDVSGQTALKYLNELEEEGAIQQVGLRGKGVYYRLL